MKVLELRLVADPDAIIAAVNRAARWSRHPNLCQYYGAHESVRDATLRIWMRHVSGPSCAALLRARKCGLPRLLVRCVLRCALSAVQFLHGAGVCAVPLSARKVMLSDAPPRPAAPVLVGYCAPPGVMRDAYAEGSVPTTAPEVEAEGDATPAADVWAVGLLAAELATGDPPLASRAALAREVGRYRAAAAADDADALLGGPALLGVDAVGDAGLSAFVRRCVRLLPAARASVDELLADPFLAAPEVLREVARAAAAAAATPEAAPPMFGAAAAAEDESDDDDEEEEGDEGEGSSGSSSPSETPPTASAAAARPAPPAKAAARAAPASGRGGAAGRAGAAAAGRAPPAKGGRR